MEKRRNYAPIIIFGFKRLEPLKACVEALLANSEARNTDLFVFVDGPREGKPDEAEKVAKVRDYVASIRGFLSLHTYFSEVNKKLGPSIIAGVSKVLDQYDRAIIMEDDLVCGKNFLSYMNQCLDYYENKENVFSVCGYSNAVKTPANYPYDAYFCPRSASTGWATWRDRWQSVDWQLDDWTAVKRNARAFNHWGDRTVTVCFADGKKESTNPGPSVSAIASLCKTVCRCSPRQATSKTTDLTGREPTASNGADSSPYLTHQSTKALPSHLRCKPSPP